MVDDRDYVPEDNEMEDEIPHDAAIDDSEESDEGDYALLSAEAFDDELQTLQKLGFIEPNSGESEGESEHETSIEDNRAANDEDYADVYGDEFADEPETIEDDERLRGPRAQHFRRRRQNRIAFLPLALYLLGLGAYLIAREQHVEDLPDFSTLAIGSVSVLVAAFTMIFHALLSGRRERGLLVFGLWLGVTAGLIAALVYFIDDQPDAVEWWPLLPGALGLTLFVNYMIERTHDARLLWLGILSLAAAGVAYAFTSDTIDEETFSQIADYWPLLLSVIGIGVVPLVFRRHLE